MSDEISTTPVPDIHELSLEHKDGNLEPTLKTKETGGTLESSAAASEGLPNEVASTSDQSNEASKPSVPLKVPFAHPLPSCEPKIRPDLTVDQSTKYDQLLSTVSEWTDIPNTSAKNATTSPITTEERMWLTRDCLLRYLRATNWSPTEAPKRLRATLTWRREYGVLEHTPDYISIENETGKQQILGYDNSGRPCLYMNPALQNTKRTDRQLQHLVFMLDRAIELMPIGQETIALLINFKNSGQAANPSVSQGKQTLNILQGHYPERLGRALISDLPWYITTFFKLISPFIDPVTKEKMVFNEDLRKHVPPSQLDKEYGGDCEFLYDHAIYWPALNKLCEERRVAYRERWERAGSKIGESETYLRGGNQETVEAEKTTESTDLVDRKTVDPIHAT